MNKKIIIRTDGNKRIGMGHIYQDLILAEDLKKRYNCKISFLTKNNSGALNLIKKHSFKVYPLRYNISKKEEMKALSKIIKEEKPDAILFDLPKYDFIESYRRKLSLGKKIKIVLFTIDTKKREIDADVVFFVNCVNWESEYYKNTRGAKYYFGFNYLILSNDYSKLNIMYDSGRPVRKVFVCMGGSDQNGLSFKVLKYIDRSHHHFECDLVVDRTFFDKIVVDVFINKLNHKVNVHYNVSALSGLLIASDLAITSGGNIHIERICSGVPGLVINQNSHQAIYSKMIEEYGATVNLGYYKDVSADVILNSFNELFENRFARRRISDNGVKLIDGNGLQRISKIIIENII